MAFRGRGCIQHERKSYGISYPSFKSVQKNMIWRAHSLADTHTHTVQLSYSCFTAYPDLLEQSWICWKTPSTKEWQHRWEGKPIHRRKSAEKPSKNNFEAYFYHCLKVNYPPLNVWKSQCLNLKLRDGSAHLTHFLKNYVSYCLETAPIVSPPKGQYKTFKWQWIEVTRQSYVINCVKYSS